MKRFNPLVIAIGSLFLLLVAVDSLSDRGGTLGQYADGDVLPGIHGRWRPPAWLFHRTGCCVDDIRNAEWDGRVLTLRNGSSDNIRLFLDSGMQFKPRSVPGGSDLLAVAYWKDRIWVPEKLHERLLEVKPGGQYETEVGSNVVGPVNGLTITCTDPVTLVMTTGARTGMHQFLLQQQALQQQSGGADAHRAEKLYLSRSGLSPPALVQITPDNNNGAVLLDVGDELSAPSGLALSTDGRTLYIADEREDELAWLKLIQTDDPARPWVSRGKLARFRLSGSQHGFVRSLVVLNYEGQDILAGATPAGLQFLSTDGHRLGSIQTNEQISWVIRGQRGKTALLYVVAGRSIWQTALRRLTPAASTPCSAAIK
jgi:hypothetical protein